ncbi:Zinc finger, LIM-type [Kalmanozyma brasiliensis GHG001]|uniref:Zinc finger, LIM-type n=1 Tax=Kalmanozyma brasiliensis (strain GHG001) TaxID=1365824 RepID=UPI001CE7FB04|nr:Zinc finger, LIM-type [Kalmanozyma brasiliensis GHG001]EST07351.2 Zinc finger, LIM-type [Kalmanozyma brasiliensis GHG001]
MSTPALASPTVNAPSPSRLGFCQRCGDPISGKVRCSKCSGTSKEASLRSTKAFPTANKPDPWAHRYVHGDSSLQSASGADQEDDEYTHDRPPPRSPKRSSYGPALGFGMPSCISRDLRTSTSSRSGFGLDPNASVSSVDISSSNLNLPLTEPLSRRPSQDYSAPIVKGSDGVLSKVCGSLVEPSESRNRWACADCAAVFARDSTLYAAPPSHQSQDSSYYCRDCYAKRYSLGGCRACGRDVLGSTKEYGKYVKASSGIWHGKCWKCTSCFKGGADGVDILVGMDGNPTCEGCFDRPRRAPSAEPPVARNDPDDSRLPDMRRVTRIGATRNGPMGATIAELTKKLGQQSVSSAPRIPFSSRSNSNTSLPQSTSSLSAADPRRSPVKSQYIVPTPMPASPGKAPSMTRSGSLTGSPPKPRPLTAQFRDGLNLAAFKPSFASNTESTGLTRRDSRSRSVSPIKRPEWRSSTAAFKQQSILDRTASVESGSSTTRVGSKVPGSPSLHPIIASSNRLRVATTDAGRPRTSGGFIRPHNDPFSGKKVERQNILQGEKAGLAESREPSDGSLPSPLEPAEGTVQCAACHLLPFEKPGSIEAQEVVMVTLADQVHLHADCFRCSICHDLIDGTKTFVRLQDDLAHPALADGLPAYAHPRCSPTIQLKTVPAQVDNKGTPSGGQKSYRTSLDPANAIVVSRDGSLRSHATHQRELKPSPAPSPATSMRERNEADRPSILPSATLSRPSAMIKTSSKDSASPAPSSLTKPSAPTTTSTARRFQPTAGAAPPTQSTILTPSTGRPANPAAGIFSRISALSSANPALLAPVSGGKFGGMHTCAFCGLTVSSLEAVLGPRGTQWHRSCLICRAPPQKAAKEGLYEWRKPKPTVCGKRLDSGAKVNGDGEVRCRECYDRESGAFKVKV